MCGHGYWGAGTSLRPPWAPLGSLGRLGSPWPCAGLYRQGSETHGNSGQIALRNGHTLHLIPARHALTRTASVGLPTGIASVFGRFGQRADARIGARAHQVQQRPSATFLHSSATSSTGMIRLFLVSLAQIEGCAVYFGSLL